MADSKELGKVAKKKTLSTIKTGSSLKGLDNLVSVLDNYLEGFSTEQLEDMDGFFQSMIAGQSVVSGMICKGRKCPFVNTCPYTPKANWPVGKPCPKEVIERIKRIQMLCEDLGIDVGEATNPVDFRLIIEVVDLEILIDRMREQMAADGMTLEEMKIEDGIPFKTVKAHPLWKPYIEAGKHKKQLLAELKATRASVNNNASKNVVVVLSEKKKMDDKYNKAATVLEELNSDVIDADYQQKESFDNEDVNAEE